MHGDTAERLRPEFFSRTADSAGAEKDAQLPGVNDLYQAAGFAESGGLSRLVLVMGREGFKPGGTAYYFLQYVHVGLGEFGYVDDGQFYRFVYADLQPKLVTLHGRNLMRICDLYEATVTDAEALVVVTVVAGNSGADPPNTAYV